MIVLGLNTMQGAAAALVRDGRIVAAAEEERFTRVKHQEGVPRQAIRYCLLEAGIGLPDVDVVALSWQPWRLGRRALYTARFALASPRRFFVKARRGAREVLGDEWGRMLTLPWRLPALLGEDARACRYVFRYMDHHRCHAASAFLPSPFERAAILTMDGAGESACITFGRGDGTRMRSLGVIELPHSLGHMYSAATAFLGFRPNSGEGKVMGLSPYGRDGFGAAFERMVTLKPRGRITVDLALLDYHLAREGSYSAATRSTFGDPRIPESAIEQRHQDLACSLQAALERAVLHLADHLHRETGLDNLCLAGGVALNAAMNRRLLETSPFGRIFVQPAAGDPGTALGAALCASRREEGRERMHHTFWGPAATDSEIADALRDRGLAATRPEDVGAEVASLLARGLVVGWFQGHMEWGPRALGSRSILADPRRPDMKDILNQRVKHRESFRPFAPAVLAEAADEYFEPPSESEFMTQVVPVRKQYRERIPAGVHVDGTARLQTVSRESNPAFHALIEHFRRLTGVPLVINTSFNVRGEPIVCRPAEAIACYLNTGMDALAIGGFLLVKRNEPAS